MLCLFDALRTDDRRWCFRTENFVRSGLYLIVLRTVHTTLLLFICGFYGLHIKHGAVIKLFAHSQCDKLRVRLFHRAHRTVWWYGRTIFSRLVTFLRLTNTGSSFDCTSIYRKSIQRSIRTRKNTILQNKEPKALRLHSGTPKAHNTEKLQTISNEDGCFTFMLTWYTGLQN